ncbi:MAG: HAMP domain-containing sensor histidine kinase [Patescibacteria group bacterium]
MAEKVEKIIFYILGGVGGAVLGFIVLSFRMSYFANENHSFVVAITSLIGVLVSIIFVNYEKQKTLKTNSAVRDETVALITHEMKTGLTSTGWAIEMILQNYGKAITEEDKKMLEGVVNSIYTTIMHSVNLLDVSLLDIGKLKISLEKFDLKEIEQNLKETIEKYAFGAQKKGIHLTSEIHLNHESLVEVDLLRLRIILENLLENALQYTLGDIREIAVHIGNDEKTLNISVSDSGIGIPEAEKEKIFLKFFRASNAKKELNSGSGIGLYMTDQYIKAHRGSIRFETELGKGTTFYVSIPLKTAANVGEFLTKI